MKTRFKSCLCSSPGCLLQTSLLSPRSLAATPQKAGVHLPCRAYGAEQENVCRAACIAPAAGMAHDDWSQPPLPTVSFPWHPEPRGELPPLDGRTGDERDLRFSDPVLNHSQGRSNVVLLSLTHQALPDPCLFSLNPHLPTACEAHSARPASRPASRPAFTDEHRAQSARQPALAHSSHVGDVGPGPLLTPTGWVLS